MEMILTLLRIIPESQTWCDLVLTRRRSVRQLNHFLAGTKASRRHNYPPAVNNLMAVSAWSRTRFSSSGMEAQNCQNQTSESINKLTCL